MNEYFYTPLLQQAQMYDQFRQQLGQQVGLQNANAQYITDPYLANVAKLFTHTADPTVEPTPLLLLLEEDV